MKDWVEKIEAMNLEDFNAMLFKFLDRYKKAAFVQKLLNAVEKKSVVKKKPDKPLADSYKQLWNNISDKISQDNPYKFKLIDDSHNHYTFKEEHDNFKKYWLAFKKNEDEA